MLIVNDNYKNDFYNNIDINTRSYYSGTYYMYDMQFLEYFNDDDNDNIDNDYYNNDNDNN